MQKVVTRLRKSVTVLMEMLGEWERVTRCQERVRALEEAGLGRFAAEHAAEEGWIPGVSSPDELTDPRRPCDGAVPLSHGHFFTEDGDFGSRDAGGDQVDDGGYASSTSGPWWSARNAET